MSRSWCRASTRTAPSRELLGKMDIFRVQRVVFGHPELVDEVEQGGVAGMLHRRRGAPAAPPGHGVAPPVTPELKDKFFRKVQWNDEEPVAARSQQDHWYQWQTHVVWAEFWDRHTRAVASSARAGPAGPGGADQGADRVRPPGRGGLQPPVGRAVPQARRRVLPAARRDGPDGAVLPAGVPAAARAHGQGGPHQRQLHRGRPVERWSAPSPGPRRSRSASSRPPITPSPTCGSRSRPRSRSSCGSRRGEQPMLPRLQDLLAEAAGHGDAGPASRRTTWTSSAASSPGCCPPTSPRRAAAR